MQLRKSGAQIFVPDDTPQNQAIERTTHMAIGAHQDDIPIMAHHGIMSCFGRPDRWFLGVTVTDGAGSPRGALYADYTDEQMREVRNAEETKAAVIGDYTAALLLDYPSKAVKDPDDMVIIEDLTAIIAAAHPEVVYTHNLAAALMGVYDSQVSGGKRYDLATEGRRLAHATFSESHAVDDAQALIYAMDLTPLISDDDLDPTRHVIGHLDRLQADIVSRIGRVGPPSKSVLR